MTTSLDRARPRPTPIPTVPTQRAVRPTALPTEPMTFTEELPRRRWMFAIAILTAIGTVLALVSVGAVQFAESTNQEVQQAVGPTAAPTTPHRIDAIPPSQPTGSDAGPGSDEAYLIAIRGAGLDKYGPEADLVALGHNVCEGYPSGLSYGDMVRALTTTGYALPDAEAQVAIATAAYCPNFGDSVPSSGGA